MPRRSAKQSEAAQSVPVFLVTFEHAQHSFKCVLLDWDAPDDRKAKQWVVTVAGRPVWSFEAKATDTRDSVQGEVKRWWDETR